MVEEKNHKKYVYIWAGVVNVEVFLGEDKKICLLVIIEATEKKMRKPCGYQALPGLWILLRSLIEEKQIDSEEQVA